MLRVVLLYPGTALVYGCVAFSPNNGEFLIFRHHSLSPFWKPIIFHYTYVCTYIYVIAMIKSDVEVCSAFSNIVSTTKNKCQRVFLLFIWKISSASLNLPNSTERSIRFYALKMLGWENASVYESEKFKWGNVPLSWILLWNIVYCLVDLIARPKESLSTISHEHAQGRGAIANLKKKSWILYNLETLA